MIGDSSRSRARLAVLAHILRTSVLHTSFSHREYIYSLWFGTSTDRIVLSQSEQVGSDRTTVSYPLASSAPPPTASPKLLFSCCNSWTIALICQWCPRGLKVRIWCKAAARQAEGGQNGTSAIWVACARPAERSHPAGTWQHERRQQGRSGPS